MPLTALLIEDNPDDAWLIRRMLAQGGWNRSDLICAKRLSAGLDRLDEAGVDVVLLDLSLPDSQGLETLTRVQNRAPQVPIVVLTGLDDEQLAVQAVRAGAQDYLVKDRVNDELLKKGIRYAVERKRGEEDLRQRNRELEMLSQAGQVISSSLDLDQVLASLLEQVRRLLDVTATSIWLLDSESQALICRQATGPGYGIVQGWRLAAGRGIAGWVAQRGESVIVPDALADERHFGQVDRETGLALRAILSTPLRAQGRMVGVLQAVDTSVDRFGQAELSLLESLAASAAVAIDNARLYEQAQAEIAERRRAEEALRRRNQDLELLNRVIAATASTLDGEQVLQTACQELARVFDLPQVAASLLDDEAVQGTAVVEPRESGRPSALGSTYPVSGNPLAKYILEHPAPLVAVDARADERLAPIRDWIDQREIVSLLIVPLIVRGKVAGAFSLSSLEPRPFSQAEISLAQNVAAAAAQALEMGQLYERLERHTIELETCVAERTAELNQMVSLMAGREVRMAELKEVIQQLREQIQAAGLTPIADDPLAAWQGD